MCLLADRCKQLELATAADTVKSDKTSRWTNECRDCNQTQSKPNGLHYIGSGCNRGMLVNFSAVLPEQKIQELYMKLL